MNKKYDKIDISGCQINNLTFYEATNQIEKFIVCKEKHYVVTPNVDHIIKLQYDKEFKEIYKNASLVVADGMPLVWASRFLGMPLKERVNGTDLFLKLCEIASVKGYKLFFLGGRPQAVLIASEKLKILHSNLQIVGTYSPPFDFEKNKRENDKIVKMIKEAKPDILFVGLGAPKQEKWIYKHKEAYEVPVSVGIGVSFEFVAGMVKRAPMWMQKAGLEWFWRLMMEPGRLWKRYLIDDMKFFGLVLAQKIKRR